MTGSLRQYGLASFGINYWSHAGGYPGGFVLSYILGFQRPARREAVEKQYPAPMSALSGKGAVS
ncbi:MAG: hypothetical protein ACQET7_03025 [Thermodesulfobacteriota bacterium]